ncbi:hypothetical protein [Deinococcus maricopensis]|uniref:DUF3298 domain-containing protein n=1 Tax=Deinococcus maricopensis (strain DSM 21211 / LMG 22137 / NRRL B-23946 / LB-34) TaxID=709986 RepID=E8U5U2_DEIML|nr:hypothetical protein [Deinococcus maricopensis]ADV66431.1 hypothetical protein Deima_0775 [Deinococcus maricopensis DSM 21211]
MHRALTTTLLLLSAASAAPTLPAGGVYRGTVGTLPVVLKLAGENSAYFYTSRGVNLRLTPARDDAGRLRLTEVVRDYEADNGTRVTGRFVLSPNGAALRGTWTDANGTRTLPVNLAPVRGADVPPALPLTPVLKALRASDVFNYLRVNHAWVSVPAQKAFGGLGGVREPHSGVTYPRVPGAAALNGALQDLQLTEALDALECESTVPPTQDPELRAWEASTRVEYRTTRTLTLVTEGMGFCAGAHPFDIADAVTLDTRTGARVNVRGIWSDLSDKALRTLYRQQYARTRATPDDQPCREAINDGSDTPDVYPTARGLALWLPGLPHVIFACNEVITVPYAQLRPALNKAGAYAADFQR